VKPWEAYDRSLVSAVGAKREERVPVLSLTRKVERKAHCDVLIVH
jgi:hypothetical protein